MVYRNYWIIRHLRSLKVYSIFLKESFGVVLDHTLQFYTLALIVFYQFLIFVQFVSLANALDLSRVN